jgi:hypothetical protein
VAHATRVAQRGGDAEVHGGSEGQHDEQQQGQRLSRHRAEQPAAGLVPDRLRSAAQALVRREFGDPGSTDEGFVEDDGSEFVVASGTALGRTLRRLTRVTHSSRVEREAGSERGPGGTVSER